MNLQTRLEALENKLKSNNPDLPSCILFVVEDGRINQEPDDTPIVRLTANNTVYSLQVNESEETFVIRAAKAKLPLKDSVPSLFAWTESTG